MRVQIAIIAVIAFAETAAAEPDRVCALVLRHTNEGRLQLGVGGAVGWRPLADAHLRYHVFDRFTVGGRARFAADSIPYAGEGELGFTLGLGKMLFPGDLIVRTDLVILTGAGASRDGPYAFAGAALRVQPRSLADVVAIELGMRESWVPLPPTTMSRAVLPPPATGGLVTEVFASISVMWPGMRRECVVRC